VCAWDEWQVAQLKEMFMPFSIGKRSCIGQNLAIMELRVILANIVKHFDFELVEDIELDLFVTLKPVKFDLRIFRRQIGNV
jgi:cytochrome P450